MNHVFLGNFDAMSYGEDVIEAETVQDDLLSAPEQREGCVGVLTSDLRSLTPLFARSVPSGPLAAANKYRFSSKEWDDNAGLYYYLYRFYDPNLQRWVNRDPFGELGFEWLRAVTDPLFVRKLRLGINDSEMQIPAVHAVHKFFDSLSRRAAHTSRGWSDFETHRRYPFLTGLESVFPVGWKEDLLQISLNEYEFDRNASVVFYDPDGCDSSTAFKCAGAILAGIGALLAVPVTGPIFIPGQFATALMIAGNCPEPCIKSQPDFGNYVINTY